METIQVVLKVLQQTKRHWCLTYPGNCITDFAVLNEVTSLDVAQTEMPLWMFFKEAIN